MKRIDTANRAVALFGVGRDGFKASVPGVSAGTELTAKWFNAVQEAVVRTIEAAGIVLSEADFDQFTAAVQSIATKAASTKVSQGGGKGQVTGTVKIGAGANGKLKGDLNGADLGNFAFEAWVAAQVKTVADALAGKERKFDSGTQMLFQQATAPVGWTKITTHNNKALRVVSGAVGSGGTMDFTSAFTNRKVDGTALTIEQMPTHNHSDGTHTYLLRAPYNGSITGTDTSQSGSEQAVGPGDGGQILSQGLGQVHEHAIALDVKYVDVIIARKN
jgi:hypothetical protein